MRETKLTIEKNIKRVIKQLYGIDYDISLERSKLSDLAFPCFKLSKFLKEKKIDNLDPQTVSEIISIRMNKIAIKGIEKIVSLKGYVNIYFDFDFFVKKIIKELYRKKEKFAYEDLGNRKTVVIDYSSPNIAKPFGIAHLRSTIIGGSIARILSYLNYKVLRVNHIGDWGTQFGKLLVAYKKWGDKKELKKRGIHYLLELYIKFHNEIKNDSKLEEEAKKWFVKLENGDKEAFSLWELFSKISLDEFERYYSRLNIEFDYFLGESFYANLVERYLKKLSKKIKIIRDDGAEIIKLENMPPFFIRKSDGTTTYHTRDLVAAIHRIEKQKAKKILYVVARQQALHLKQLFKVMCMLGYDSRIFEHIEFGNMTFEGKMMKTRLGNFILLEEVLDKAKELALRIIKKKNPKLRNKQNVAEKVGLGAIIFNDLSQDRTKDIDFSWDKALNFEGETGPYLQYTYARICSLLRKARVEKNIKPKIRKFNTSLIKDKEEKNLIKDIIKMISEYKEVVKLSAVKRKPHLIARHLLSLSKRFNEYYDRYRIISDDVSLVNSKLIICSSIKKILKHGLYLLMIDVVEEM